MNARNILWVILAGLLLSVSCGSQPTPSNNIYAKGETIQFSIDDRVLVQGTGGDDQHIYYIRPSGGSGLQLVHSCLGILGAGSDQYCVNGEVETVVAVHCSDCLWIGVRDIHETYSWDQRAYVRVEEECTGQTIHREVLEQVPAGEYEIVINVALEGIDYENISYDDMLMAGEERVVKKFTIQ